MAGILIKARVPGLRDGDFGGRDWQIDMANLQTESLCCSGDRKRDRSNDVRRRRRQHRRMETGDNEAWFASLTTLPLSGGEK